MTRDGGFTWCLGRFRASDGAYLGPLELDTSLQQPSSPTHLSNGHMVLTRPTPSGIELRVRDRDHTLRDRLLTASLTHLRSVLLSASGDSALVTRSDGRREVVSLPSGLPILPLPATGHETSVTASPTGDRIALGDGRTVTVYLRDLRGTQRMSVLSQRHSRITYARDGRTLLVQRGDDTLLTVYREAPVPSSPPRTLRFSPPESLRPGAAAPAWYPELRRGPRAAIVPRAEHGLVQSWFGGGVRAALFASDASELGEFSGRSTGWARAALDRFAPGGYDPTAMRLERSPGGERTVVFRRRLRGLATGEEWLTLRVSERAGVLYRVEFVAPEGVVGRVCVECTEASREARRALLTDPFVGPRR